MGGGTQVDCHVEQTITLTRVTLAVNSVVQDENTCCNLRKERGGHKRTLGVVDEEAMTGTCGKVALETP